MSDAARSEGAAAFVDAERLTTLLVDTVACYSPSFAEEPVVEILCEALNEARLPYRLQLVDAGGSSDRSNIIVELGPQPPALLLVGHIDTIPLVHDEELGARRDGDLLYGLGAADMKSGCVAMVEALAAVRASGVTPSRGVALALVVGEEEYGDGSIALLEELRAPMIVIGEPTGLVPCTSHHGYYEVSLEVEGSRAHAALPDVGTNAIHAMLAWVQRIVEAWRALPCADELAINLREITGGESRFVVADRCSALVDIHVPAGTPQAVLSAGIERARAALLAERDTLRMGWKVSYWGSGYAVPPGAPVLTPLAAAFERLGRPYRPAAFRSHSDGNLFHAAGISPVIFGPGRLEAAHTRDEHVSITEVIEGAKLYAALIEAACVDR